MKIGDGGLQALMNEGNIFPRQLDPARDVNSRVAEAKGIALRVDENALFKAVTQLNETAQKHNQPLHFDLTEANRAVLVTHTGSGETMQLTPEQAVRLGEGGQGHLVNQEV